MTTPAILIRNRIEATLTAAGLLGVYHQPSGETVPAIWLGDPPEGTTVEGLECLIAPNPKPITPDMFGVPDLPRAYLVRLVNNAEQADALQDALNALTPVFWPLWDEPTPPIYGPDMLEQTTFSLLFDPEQYPEETP